MPAVSEKKAAPALVILTGNPNCGKTTLFNALTGLRAKVGNYAGVTVERKEGTLLRVPREFPITILDLPGTYSLSPQSLDEQIVRDVLFHNLAEVAVPDLVVIVVDASNLERNLYYATQVIELGYPTLMALNMIDVAEDNGRQVQAGELAEILGVPVVPIIASREEGLSELRAAILERLREHRNSSKPACFCRLPEVLLSEVAGVSRAILETLPNRAIRAQAEALLVLSDEKTLASNGFQYPAAVRSSVESARQRLEEAGIVWRSAVIEGRYARVSAIQGAVTAEISDARDNYSDQLDRLLTHKVWGILIFTLIMALMFQSIFTFAKLPMNALDQGVTHLGDWVGRLIPPGDLHNLVEDGVVAGVGAVVVFLPQICLLFLFIGLLEDTGYMARAAFLMDRLMSKVGLHGKSFIPMLSSFACAIPGIMATRTIESPKDRLATILVAPLMSCSARLPVYTLLIGACIPDRRIMGVFKLAGAVLFVMYFLGIVVALLMAWLFKRTLLRGEPPLLIMELPPYKRPALRAVLRHMWDRARLFLRRAGTIILGINILLWFLATYPRSAELSQRYATERNAIAAMDAPAVFKAVKLMELGPREAGEKLRNSFAGRMGRLIEPAIAPLGMDWKVGIGIVTSFAAREVFVSTMSTVYNVGGAEPSQASTQSLEATLKVQKRPDGSVLFTPLMAITLMVFYVFALQCVSTVAVVRRETNSWKWPLFQWVYMGVLAWGLAFLTYHGGRLLGWH
jgi:ferrous iron transport protein B